MHSVSFLGFHHWANLNFSFWLSKSKWQKWIFDRVSSIYMFKIYKNTNNLRKLPPRILSILRSTSACRTNGCQISFWILLVSHSESQHWHHLSSFHQRIHLYKLNTKQNKNNNEIAKFSPCSRLKDYISFCITMYMYNVCKLWHKHDYDNFLLWTNLDNWISDWNESVKSKKQFSFLHLIKMKFCGTELELQIHVNLTLWW